MAQKRRRISGKNKLNVGKKNHLSTTDVEHFRHMLLEKRAEILGNITEIKGEALDKPRSDATGDLSRIPIHMADIGTDNYDQELALGLMDSERKLLHKVNDALQRIDQETYGICKATGKPIAKARLEAKPWAKYSIEYARMLEQGLVTEPE